MKYILAALVILLLILQYNVWFGPGSMQELRQLRLAVEQQQKENAHLRQRNKQLEAEVSDLKKGLAAVEERARKELGMIKEGETFFQIIDNNKKDSATTTPGQ